MGRDAIDTYLRKCSGLERWPLVPANLRAAENVVAIPALAESPGLFDTLHDLEANSDETLQRTAILCVVNNRPAATISPETRANNAATLRGLGEYARATPLRLAWVDAATSGNEMPEKGGVGLARKIGLDWGLALLRESGHPDGPLICLDADTRVEPGYLDVLRTFFQERKRWAAVLEYAHPLETAHIIAYELFLRYHELGLAFAGSPYAFPTVGSAMACTGRAYAAVSGMNTRQAGEDFYFLQQLAKTGPVERITGTTVHPSPRASERVPFGTGRSMSRFLAGETDPCRAGDPQGYAVLRAWLQCAPELLGGPVEALLSLAEGINVELADFLQGQGFAEAWPRIQRNHPGPDALRKQFHVWFDGFRTLKLLHHLRDHGYPETSLINAVGTLLDWQGVATPPLARDVEEGEKGLLLQLRALCRRGL